MKMILRPAQKKDLPAIKKLLKPWIDEEPSVLKVLGSLFHKQSTEQTRCTILEMDRTLLCVSLWTLQSKESVRLRALGIGPAAIEIGADERFLQEEILDWAEMGIVRTVIKLPKTLSLPLIGCLRACGFISEGFSASCALDSRPRFRLTKYFLRRSIPHNEVMGFLQEFLLSLGYEIRPEADGFGYRIKAEYRMPFMFNSWHRISRSGPEIIVHLLLASWKCTSLKRSSILSG
jgi:N-acetylglutamate synthase-like GNAT family acetyltransferase